MYIVVPLIVKLPITLNPPVPTVIEFAVNDALQALKFVETVKDGVVIEEFATIVSTYSVPDIFDVVVLIIVLDVNPFTVA